MLPPEARHVKCCDENFQELTCYTAEEEMISHIDSVVAASSVEEIPEAKGGTVLSHYFVTQDSYTGRRREK